MKFLRMFAAVVVMTAGLVYIVGRGCDYRDRKRLDYLERGVMQDGSRRSNEQWEELYRERDELRRRHPEWRPR